MSDIATCGSCGRSWDDAADPVSVSACCHWCHGRGYSTHPINDGKPDPGAIQPDPDELFRVSLGSGHIGGETTPTPPALRAAEEIAEFIADERNVIVNKDEIADIIRRETLLPEILHTLRRVLRALEHAEWRDDWPKSSDYPKTVAAARALLERAGG